MMLPDIIGRTLRHRRRAFLADSLLCTCLVAVPPISQPGASPEAPPTRSQVVATFEPPDPGRPVVLERSTSRGWRTVEEAPQDRSGAVSFDVRRGTYRARTTGAQRPSITTAPVRTHRGQVVFEETFDGPRLDKGVWNDQVRDHESVWAPRTCARSSPTARRVRDGVLHLGIRKDPRLAGSTCTYSSGGASGTHDYLLYSQVATEHTWAFRHGTFAARMRLQRARGMHSAFWLLPVGRDFVVDDPSRGTEVDIVEFFGDRGRHPGNIGSFIHYYDAGWNDVKLGSVFPDATKVLDRGEEWWEEFHVFSVEWTPHEYVFRVDGREYYREVAAVSQVPHYLVLSMIASDYQLHRLGPDDLDDTAEVDWVRVYDTAGAAPS